MDIKKEDWDNAAYRVALLHTTIAEIAGTEDASQWYIVIGQLMMHVMNTAEDPYSVLGAMIDVACVSRHITRDMDQK